MMTGQKAHLNLGSYNNPIPGMWNVDIERWVGVDEIADLNVLPWPWDDGRWYHVRAIDILEHLGKLTKVEAVRELARITAIGGTVEVRVPCGSHPWAWASLQHAHLYWFNTFNGPDYANQYFKCERIEAGFLDKYYPIAYTRLTRPLIKLLARMTLVQTITFHLRRV